MTGADVLSLLNYQLKDMQDAVYSTFDKYNAISAANRYLSRLASEFKPSMLTATETGNTVVGTSAYTLTKIPSKILDFRMNGKKIYEIEMQSIDDLTVTGTPTGYWRSAYDQVTFYPVPDAVLPYTVTMIESASDITATATLPWSNDLVDLIVVYAVGVLTGSLDLVYVRNEAGKLMRDYNSSDVIVTGYWNSYRPNGGDYQ